MEAFIGRLSIARRTLAFTGREKEIYRLRENTKSVATNQRASGSRVNEEKKAVDIEGWGRGIKDRTTFLKRETH